MLKNNILLLTLCLCFGNLGAQVQSPNWAEHIAPILYKQCASCHRASSIAPFQLLSYTDAYQNRFAIENAVVSKHMPPFPPDTKYQRYAAENTLSAAQIQTIRNWVSSAAPQGNPALAPPVPIFPTGSQVGTPDVVLRAPTYTVPAMTQDLYRCFVVPTNENVDKFLSAIEVIPGNPNIVHHVLIYQDTTNQANVLDAADPGIGYTSAGGPGFNSATLIGAWVPGTKIVPYPNGMGARLLKNAKLIVQIHFPLGSSGRTDSSKINLFYTPQQTGIREVRLLPILNHSSNMTNGPLVIPANTTRTFYEEYVNRLADATLVNAAPHMHLIGKNMKVYAVAANGRDTTPIINIPRWDFHWQGGYTFRKLIKFPLGSKLRAEAFYDNTANNPQNPSNPPQLVRLGEATTDEMMLVYFSFLAYQPGDENIVTDSTSLSPSQELPNFIEGLFVKTYPNPTNDQFTMRFQLPQNETIEVGLFDLQGKMVKTLKPKTEMPAGIYEAQIQISDLSNGVYFLVLQNKNGQQVVSKVVKE